MTTITDTLTREKIIVRTSIIGIATNLLLASFKAAVGLLAHSIAMVLDALNNLSDVLSSLITLIGVKLANKAPDKKHPLGHGRIEYISSMLVSAIVSYAGIAALVESVKKIFHPQIPIYSESFFIVVVVAIVVKLVLGRYVKRQGQKVSSGALVASGADAFFDAILSVSVLGCAIIYVLFQFSLEAYVGVGISLVIIKAGLSMLQETLHDILGQRADTKTTQLVKQIIGTEPEVRGVYDLMINNYGPNKNYASVHLELPDTMCVDEVDQLTRRIEEKVYHQTGIILTGVGVYSYNTKQGKAAQLQNDIQGRVLAHDWALQLHGFYANIEEKTLRFDVVLSFDISPQKAVEILQSEIKTAYPDYAIQIVPDVDICD